jgi:hypothetical protein
MRQQAQRPTMGSLTATTQAHSMDRLPIVSEFDAVQPGLVQPQFDPKMPLHALDQGLFWPSMISRCYAARSWLAHPEETNQIDHLGHDEPKDF